MEDIVVDDFYRIFKKYNLDFSTEINLRTEIKDYIQQNYIRKASNNG